MIFSQTASSNNCTDFHNCQDEDQNSSDNWVTFQVIVDGINATLKENKARDLLLTFKG